MQKKQPWKLKISLVCDKTTSYLKKKKEAKNHPDFPGDEKVQFLSLHVVDSCLPAGSVFRQSPRSCLTRRCGLWPTRTCWRSLGRPSVSWPKICTHLCQICTQLCTEQLFTDFLLILLHCPHFPWCNMFL